MIREAFLLLRQWWIADRIRSTPGHGQLLQLTVRSRVLVRDRLWVVVRRLEEFTGESTTIQYDLHEEDEAQVSELRVSFCNAQPTKCQIFWRSESSIEELILEDIVPLLR